LNALWLLAACAGSGDDTGANPDGDPAIVLVSPEEGETVCGTPLHVEVEVSNMELVPWEENPENPEPGTGHVDIMLNGQDASMVWVATTNLDAVDDGEYQLKVELANADHTPVKPYAGDLAYINVSAAVCGADE
jgi:hypothetical protein